MCPAKRAAGAMPAAGQGRFRYDEKVGLFLLCIRFFIAVQQQKVLADGAVAADEGNICVVGDHSAERKIFSAEAFRCAHRFSLNRIYLNFESIA